MDFLGVGIPELIVILALALIFVGPERLPEVAAQLGRWVRDLRRYAADVTSQFNLDLEEMRKELDLTRQELERTRDEVRKNTETIGTELKDSSGALSKGAEDVNRAVAGAVPREDGAPDSERRD